MPSLDNAQPGINTLLPLLKTLNAAGANSGVPLLKKVDLFFFCCIDFIFKHFVCHSLEIVREVSHVF